MSHSQFSNYILLFHLPAFLLVNTVFASTGNSEKDEILSPKTSTTLPAHPSLLYITPHPRNFAHVVLMAFLPPLYLAISFLTLKTQLGGYVLQGFFANIPNQENPSLSCPSTMLM